MLAKSHISLGLLGGIIAYPLTEKLNITKEAYFTLLLPLVLLGSLFPDIDEPKSVIGRKLPLLSKIVSLSFSHRGFTHFLAFPLIFITLGIIIAHSTISPSLFAFAYGIFLHQVGDMLTISGIPHYFFPLSKKRAILLPDALRFRTGSVKEKAILAFILTPLIAFSALHIGGADLSGVINMQNFKEIDRILSKILTELK